MDILEIKNKIEEIKQSVKDGEISYAHYLEDTLFYDFVEFAAKENTETGTIAREIQKVKETIFMRVCGEPSMMEKKIESYIEDGKLGII